MSMTKVVQMELFHVDDPDAPLWEIIAQMNQRIIDTLPLALSDPDANPGIKTTVRVFDERGAISSYIHDITALEQKIIRISKEFRSASNPKQWVLNWYQKHYNRKLIVMKDTLKDAAIEHIVAALKRRDKKAIAIERRDRSFRFVRDNEKHDVWEKATAGNVRNVWFFLYSMDDLCGEPKNNMVAHLM